VQGGQERGGGRRSGGAHGDQGFNGDEEAWVPPNQTVVMAGLHSSDQRPTYRSSKHNPPQFFIPASERLVNPMTSSVIKNQANQTVVLWEGMESGFGHPATADGSGET